VLLSARRCAKAASDARSNLLQAVGGLLLAGGAAATWQQVRVSREGQVTERFTRAVDQLGSEHLDIRLGGLYALERIARDSPGDRRSVAEILTAFIRHRAPWPPPSQFSDELPLNRLPYLRSRAPDVQAALTVLGRGPFPKPTNLSRELADLNELEGDRLDLSNVDLRKADLRRADLTGANLGGAHMKGADLHSARLEGAWLWEAHLESAWLIDAHLEWAWLVGADLQAAILCEAHLEGARLFEPRFDIRARLDGARLQSARASAKTVWPEGFDWRRAGVIRVDETRDEAIRGILAAAESHGEAPTMGSADGEDHQALVMRGGLVGRDETGRQAPKG
jgi:Pentapeptide repeats (8 copies)